MKKKITALLFTFIMSFALCSCGAGYDSMVQSDAGSGYDSVAKNGAYEAEATYDESGDYAVMGDAEYDEAYNDSDVSVETEIPDETFKKQDKIVYTADISMQTLEYDKSYSGIMEFIKSLNGFIENENETDGNHYWYDESKSSNSYSRQLNLVSRIPTEKYEEFISKLGEYGKILNKSQSADNISRQYNEVSTYIQSLTIEEKRLLDMMDKAETIDDMMSVERRLTEVQRELNSYKTNMESMKTDIAYSTVTINLKEVHKYEDVPTPVDSFGTRVKKAFVSAWENFVYFCQNFLITIIYLLPGIIVCGIIFVIILKATKSRRLKYKADMSQRRERRKIENEAMRNRILEGKKKKEENEEEI